MPHIICRVWYATYDMPHMMANDIKLGGWKFRGRSHELITCHNYNYDMYIEKQGQIEGESNGSNFARW